MIIKHKTVLFLTFLTEKIYFIKCLFRKKILGRDSFFNQQNHQGFLPIRVLQFNIIYWLETVSPIFFTKMKEEIIKKGLEPGIKYNIDRNPIIHAARLNAANINAKRQINIYETFNSYLWCISYSLLVAFDEVMQKPHLNGKYSGALDLNNSHVKAAIDVFNYGLSLKKSYSDWDYSIPNPEKFDCKYSFYIEKANSVFVSAMFFILSHEIGHSYYNHVTYTPATAAQSLQEELDADNFAIE